MGPAVPEPDRAGGVRSAAEPDPLQGGADGVHHGAAAVPCAQPADDRAADVAADPIVHAQSRHADPGLPGSLVLPEVGVCPVDRCRLP